jgi:hypothetical protein
LSLNKPTTIIKEKLIKELLVHGQPEPCNDTLSEKQQQNKTKKKREQQ